jgi:adenine-specific DNA methylase
MTIETNFDTRFVAGLALREKQIQQNYRPIIAVHKWFARRPGTLFRALTLSEFGDAPLADLYFTSNEFKGRAIADPFMGGGTPLIEANRVGCDVVGFDINPMATWIVREEIEHLDIKAYQEQAKKLITSLRAELGDLYVTDCPTYGDKGVPVKYFLWVKVIDCANCAARIDLFPGYLIAEDSRHPKNVFVCPNCGDLNEVSNRKRPGACSSCAHPLTIDGPAKRGQCKCSKCGHDNAFPQSKSGPPKHRLFAIEYYNPARKAKHKGRFFKKPDKQDLARLELAEQRFAQLNRAFVPERPIPPGDETGRLHRWGYKRYREMFNSRQLYGLELSCRNIAGISDSRIRHALATNLSDLLRYQNMLCRYDTWALKSLDIFSVHGFPVGLVQCESNLLGITNGYGSDLVLSGWNNNVGSGGWTNIMDKYVRAKRYCDHPFEVKRQSGRNVLIPIKGEWIGEKLNGDTVRQVLIRCADASSVQLKPCSLDAVFTDPPYFGNVQYGELMDFCYAWLQRLVGDEHEGFDRRSTRAPEELTANETQARGLIHFTEGLAKVYKRMADALKPGAPLVFTYHHNRIEAYHAAGVAILDSGLTCSASLACPGEMGGSIHIHGTGSSIVDTVFVCRSTGRMPRRWLFKSANDLQKAVSEELVHLQQAGLKPSAGDIRCIVFGHLTRMAMWTLRKTWDPNRETKDKLAAIAEAMLSFGDPEQIAASTRAPTVVAEPEPVLYMASPSPQKARDAVTF